MANKKTKKAGSINLDTVYKEYESVKLAKQSRLDAFRRWYKLYRSTAEAKKDKWQANVFVSLVFMIVQTALPRLVKALLGDGTNFFTISPTKRNKKDLNKQKIAQALTDLIKVFLGEANFFIKMTGAILFTLLFGNCYLHVYWLKVTQKETRTKIDPKTGEETEEEVEMVIVDRPEIEVINPHDFFAPTDITDIQGPKPVFFRTWATKEELLANPVYDQAALKNVSDEANEASSSEEMRQDIGEEFISTDKVELVERHGNGRVITMANGTVIRDVAKPLRFKPFINICNYPEPNTIEGVSEVENFETLQVWINDITNLRINNLKLAVNQMFTVIRGSKINPLQMRARPGGAIEVDAHDQIKPWQFPEIKASAYEEVNHVRGLVQMITGISDYTAGGSMDKTLNDTATGIRSIIAEANERFALKIRIWRVTVIQELLKMIVEMIEAFMVKEDVKKLLGEDIPDFEPDGIDFNANYSFEISGFLSDDERSIEYDTLRVFVEFLKQLPESKLLEVDTDAIMKKIAAVLGKEQFIKEKEQQPLPNGGGAPGGPAAPAPLPGGPAAQNMAPQQPQAPQIPPEELAKIFTPQNLAFIAQKLGTTPEVIMQQINQGADPMAIIMQAYQKDIAGGMGNVRG